MASTYLDPSSPYGASYVGAENHGSFEGYSTTASFRHHLPRVFGNPVTNLLFQMTGVDMENGGNPDSAKGSSLKKPEVQPLNNEDADLFAELFAGGEEVKKAIESANPDQASGGVFNGLKAIAVGAKEELLGGEAPSTSVQNPSILDAEDMDEADRAAFEELFAGGEEVKKAIERANPAPNNVRGDGSVLENFVSSVSYEVKCTIEGAKEEAREQVELLTDTAKDPDVRTAAAGASAVVTTLAATGDLKKAAAAGTIAAATARNPGILKAGYSAMKILASPFLRLFTAKSGGEFALRLMAALPVVGAVAVTGVVGVAAFMASLHIIVAVELIVILSFLVAMGYLTGVMMNLVWDMLLAEGKPEEQLQLLPDQANGKSLV